MQYHIIKELSLKDNALVIKIEIPSVKGPISNSLWRSKASGHHLHVMNLLVREEVKFQAKTTGKKIQEDRLDFTICHISYSESHQALQLLAATGMLYIDQQQLVCDFYGPADFYYHVCGDQITGRIKTQSQDFSLKDCVLIGAGPPHYFIKGIILKIIKTSVAWSALKKAFSSRLEPTDLELEDNDPLNPKIVYEGGSREVLKLKLEPLPLFILKDPTGAFADLWMDYGAEKKHLLQNHEGPYRQFEKEKEWEKDLLETGFIKKIVGSTHYFCPLDNVSKSLSFLLEIGWKILDFQNREVLIQGVSELSASSLESCLLIKGKIHFGSCEANLENVLEAYSRKEKFIQLSSNAVGLIQEKNGVLQALTQEKIIAGLGVSLPKAKLSTLFEVIDQAPQITVETPLKNLREKLSNFKGIEETLPTSDFVGQLRPYQQEGVNWLYFLYTSGLHGMLADDMGLGKTVQVIAFLSTLKALHKPVLIIMPTSLVFNWQKEIEKFLPHSKVFIHQGVNRARIIEEFPRHGIILTTYALLRIDLTLLSKLDYEAVILDEAQAIKNKTSQTFQAVLSLKSDFRLSITGTPVENTLSELWAHFNFLLPELFGDEKAFLQNSLESDPRFLKTIQKKIRPFFLRRKKEEVAKDLPEKIEQVVWVEMGQERQIYDQFLMDFKNNLLQKIQEGGVQKYRMQILEAILRLRQICAHPLLVTNYLSEGLDVGSAKMEVVLQDIELVAEEGRKVLVYSQFTQLLKLLGKRLKEKNLNFAYLDGEVDNREVEVNRFQEDLNLPIFLISLKAGGVGLNLTAADYVFLLDPWWNEAVENQAIDRAHRIGRKDTVIAKRYVTLATVEEKMMNLKTYKRNLINNLFDEDLKSSQMTLDDLLILFT